VRAHRASLTGVRYDVAPGRALSAIHADIPGREPFFVGDPFEYALEFTEFSFG
jgi:hypothetical protein